MHNRSECISKFFKHAPRWSIYFHSCQAWNYQLPSGRPSGVCGQRFPTLVHLTHYCRSLYFNKLRIIVMRHVIRRISGRRGGLFGRKSHHRKWHSRYFLHVTLREREIWDGVIRRKVFKDSKMKYSRVQPTFSKFESHLHNKQTWKTPM